MSAAPRLQQLDSSSRKRASSSSGEDLQWTSQRLRQLLQEPCDDAGGGGDGGCCSSGGAPRAADAVMFGGTGQCSQHAPGHHLSAFSREAAARSRCLLPLFMPVAAPPLRQQQHPAAASAAAASLPAQCRQQQPIPAAAAAAAVATAAASAAGLPGSAAREPATSPVRPGSALPPKAARLGDYARLEPNPRWDAAGLEAAAAAGAARLRPPADAAVLPAAGSAEFAVLMLAHEAGVPCAPVWEAWQTLHQGRVALGVHLKAGVPLSGRLPGVAWLRERLLDTRLASQWGDLSLTRAVLAAAAELLARCPRARHVALVSGQDVPVARLPLPLPDGLACVGRFQFGRAFDTAARREAAAQLQAALHMRPDEAAAWGEALTFHHTWMVLDRRLLLALLSKEEELLAVGAVLHERFMQPDAAVAADEFLLVTGALRYGFARHIQCGRLDAWLASGRRQQRKHERQRLHHQQAQPGGGDATKAAAPRDSPTSSSSSVTVLGGAARSLPAAEVASTCEHPAAKSSAGAPEAGHRPEAGHQLHQQAEGVLLDACPTLALFHPTRTRHPHTWTSFTASLECDVHAADGSNQLTLAQVLALAAPNGSLFLRKVGPMGRLSNLERLLLELAPMWLGGSGGGRGAAM